ncbi:MAG: hypothetical protein M5U34_45830 [Chloroflexi bacterium]|nr:hypothetical protein [Chloroflexota bacterium]
MNAARLSFTAWSPGQQELLTGGVTSAAALIVYLLTMARDLTWAHYGIDGGDLITAVITQGVPPSQRLSHLHFAW